MIYFFFRHIGENWEAYKTLPHFSSTGTVFGSPTESLLIIGMKMQWSPMNGTSDPLRFEELNKSISINIEPVEAKLDRKEMP